MHCLLINCNKTEKNHHKDDETYKMVKPVLSLISILFFLAFSPSECFSQTFQISGQVTDESGEPVDYAYIIFMQPSDSTYLDGCMSDTAGVFSIRRAKGKYILQAKHLGYLDVYKNIELNSDMNLGKLVLQTNTVDMKEITVVASRPIVKREVDRLVFDAENSVSAHGANALELLQEVPGLRADNNSISVIGKGEVKVFINDRETKLSEESLMDLLRSYQAEEISKVEVITTPPARYDAAGNTGIVNLVLKKKPKDYFGGVFSSTEYYESYKDIDLGYTDVSANINFNKNKISYFLNSNGATGKTGYIENNSIFYPDETWDNKTTEKIHRKPFNLRTGIDYALNDKYNIGIHATYNKNNRDEDEQDHSDLTDVQSSETNSRILGQTETDRTDERSGANFHLDRQIDSLGKKALFDADYLHYKTSSTENHYSNRYDPDMNPVEGELDTYDEDQSHKVNAFSSSLDFILPFKLFSATAGLKFSHTENEYDKQHYHDSNLGDQHDRFEYHEDIASGYVDFTRQVSSKITLKAGLRVENTHTKGYSLSGERSKDNYTKVFPTAYLTLKPAENHVFNMNFSNRINRPSYNMVNPFRFYSNSYTYVEGKADLQPYYTYNTELGYTYKNNLNISALYSFANHIFGQTIALDSTTKITAITWDNYISTKKFVITNSYTFKKPEWMKIYLQHGLNYQKNTSSYPSNPGVKGWNYFAEIRNNLYFDRNKTFTGTVSAVYTSTQYVSNVTLNPDFQINAGLRYNFLKNKLTASVNATNLFNISSVRGKTRSNNMEMKIRNRYSISTYRISLSYNFGAHLSSKSREYSNSDIQDRL